MRLKKLQIAELLTLIAEGLQSGEINDRAGEFDQPFNVSRQQVDYHRKASHAKITVLKETYENGALNRGLARKCIRVQKLQKIAKLLEADIDYLFIFYANETDMKDKKMAIDSYRGVLDDIAKEMGGRVHKTEVTGDDGGPVTVKIVSLGGINPDKDI